MKQVLRKGLKDIVVETVPDPSVTPHHVVVQPMYSLISSGTETASIHTEGLLRGVADNPSHLRKVYEVMRKMGPAKTVTEVRAKLSEYAVLGYSGAGIVAATHPSVTDIHVGDRVAYGGEGTGHGEAILVGQNLVARIPDSVPYTHATFTTLGSIALNAVRTAGIGVGDTVAVLGVGLVGQLVSQLVRLQGGRAVAIDLKPERLELAKRLGAENTLSGGDGILEAAQTITEGRGFDCVIVAAAAKSAIPCQQALRICRDRGRLVIVGAVDLNLPWQEMYLKEIQLFMSRAYGPGSYDPAYEKKGIDYPISYIRWTERRNMQEFLRLIADHKINVQDLITHEWPLEEAATAYQTIMAPGSNSLAVLLRYPLADQPTSVKPYAPVSRVAVSSDNRQSSRNVLRAALVGAGNLARWEHLPVLQKLRGVQLQAVHSSSGARGKSYAERFHAAYCTSSFQDILDDKDIDLVVITSRNQHHAEQAAASLRAGKHVFVEKPMALTEDECRLLVRAVAETGKHLAVGFNRRFAPYYMQMKRALSQRKAPVVINCRVNSPGISGAYWMADASIGGAILGEACHFVDLMYWLLESEPVSVMAYSLPLDRTEPIGQNNLTATFKFADGSIGNLTYCTVGSNSSGGERVEAYGHGVGAVVEDFTRVEIKGITKRVRTCWWPEKGYQQQMASFISDIVDGRTPSVNIQDGVRSTIGCLGMLESARSKVPYAIDLKPIFSEDN